MNKTIVIFLIAALSVHVSNGQTIEWTEFKNLEDSLRKQRKPVMIFIHTNWCKYCALQKNTTFADSTTSSFLNKNYYNLLLDAEANSIISFLGREYDLKSNRGYHQLAETLGTFKGELIFPTTVFLSEKLEIKKVLQGFQQVSDLQKSML